MAILKNDYGTLPVISPYFINIEKDISKEDVIIVVDVINNNEPGEINMQLTGEEIWLQVEVDNKLVVLSEAPKDLIAFTPSIQLLNKARLRLKSAELFAVQYNNTAKDDALHRTAVTGYQMGTFDKVFVKIEPIEDLITIYHE